MPRPLALHALIAAAAVAPVSAIAAPRVPAQAHTEPSGSALATVERDLVVVRPPGTESTARRKPLKLTAVPKAREVPDVEIRPKAAWLSDEGLRLTGTRLAFMHRY